MGQSTLAVRMDGRNSNHHLWNNNGTWFVHYTVYPTPVTKERVRRSLGTKCVQEARRRRDELFRRLESPSTPQGQNTDLPWAV